MITEFISKIFVINLESERGRREHIISEFSKVGITDYEFFKAINHDSKKVKDLMKTDFVFQFPPCFRCKKNKCNCDNNVLIPQQIGNWISFIDVMKKIVELDLENLIMVCEDDIKFTPYANKIFNRLDQKTFIKRGVDLEKPLLIKLEGRDFNHNHKSPKEFTILEEKLYTYQGKQSMNSNACFLINKKFAKTFIDNLKVIDCTSDMYIHSITPQSGLKKYDQSVQYFIVKSYPVYQLSNYAGNKMPSCIHPKGETDYDKERMKTHVKRIDYDEYQKFKDKN